MGVLNEKRHLVTGAYFLTLTTDGTHQLWEPHSCEWEEVYTGNRVYFLILNTPFIPLSQNLFQSPIGDINYWASGVVVQWLVFNYVGIGNN